MNLLARSLVVSLFSLGAATFTAQAQTAQPGNPNFKPQVGQAGKDVIWVPTPDALVNRMLRMAQTTEKDFVVDLGSGDGKINIAAARDFKARGLGIEYNPDMVAVSRRAAREAGMDKMVEFRQGDIFKSEFFDATVVTMYLLPQLNLRLRPILLDRMKPGTRLVSHAFTMGDWEPDETSTVENRYGYLWIVPANASGNWRVTVAERAVGNFTMDLNQTYQRVSGNARLNADMEANLIDPELRGDQIQFALRAVDGRVLNYTGTVAGNRITGTVSGNGLNSTFTAERSGAPRQIHSGTDANSRAMNN